MESAQTPFKEWRLRLGLTQAAAAKELGYTDRQCWRWDNGQAIPPRAVELAMRALEELPDAFIGSRRQRWSRADRS